MWVQDGNHILVVLGDGADGVDVVIGHADKSGDQRLKARLRLARAGRGKCGQRTSVPGALHDNDLRIGDAALMAVEPGELDCAFVGFRPGIAKENVIHFRQRTKLVR